MRKPLQPILMSIMATLSINVLCMGAPPKKSISPDQILAKVNGETITVSRFYDHLKESKTISQNPEEDKKTKDKSLNELIREILIDQKASSMDLESDTAFVNGKNKHMQDWLLQYMYKKDLQEQVEVSDREVRDHYEKFKEIDFVIPEEVQVRDLFLVVRADSTKKNYSKNLKKADKEVKKKIQQLHQRATQGEDFIELCRQYTQAPVPSRTGELGFIRKGQKSLEFDQNVFSLEKKGEISQPFRDEQGYHIVQLLDRKEKSYLELDPSLYESIKEFLKNQKLKMATIAFVDSLKKETPFVYNQEIMESSQPVVDSQVYVLAFGQKDTIRYEIYAELLSAYKTKMRMDSLDLDQKKSVLENYLALPVILQREAEKRGYADLVEYSAELKAFTLDEAKRKLIVNRVKLHFPPATREELEGYYQDHKIDFPPLGVPLHVYHIVFDDSIRAAEILKQIKAGEDFVKMAQMYFPGDQEMRDVAYDLGFITQGEMPDEFYQVALKLKVGETSDPVKTKWGYHLIRVVERKEEETTKFEDIAVAVQRALDVQKGRQYIADWDEALLNEAEIWKDEKLLEALELPKPEG